MYRLFVQDSMFYQQVIFDSQVEQLSTINFFTSFCFETTFSCNEYANNYMYG